MKRIPFSLSKIVGIQAILFLALLSMGTKCSRLSHEMILRNIAPQAWVEVKPLVAQKVIPALQCGSRIGLAAPGPFAGQSGGSGQREVLL